MDEGLMEGFAMEIATPGGTSPPPSSAKNDIKELTLGLDFCTHDLHKSNLGKLELNLKQV